MLNPALKAPLVHLRRRVELEDEGLIGREGGVVSGYCAIHSLRHATCRSLASAYCLCEKDREGEEGKS